MRSGESVVGTFVKLAGLEPVDLVARSGFDFVVVDGEHSQLVAADLGRAVRHVETRSENLLAMTQVPLGRMSEPEDIAGTVAWLLSPDARGVTGQAVDQNGGAWTG